MNLTRRETAMAFVTLVIILGGLSYYIGKDKVHAWKQSREQRELIQRSVDRASQKLRKRGVLLQQIAALKETLPVYPMNQDVISEILKQVRGLANDAQLNLSSVRPEREKQLGDLDLYEVSVNCSWDGKLDNLVYFLYALQSQGAVLDVRQLNVKPESRRPGQLKGSFIVDCAYSRANVSPAKAESETPESE